MQARDLLRLAGITTRAADSTPQASAATLPTRTDTGPHTITVDGAVSMISVYRAMSILATASAQLPLTVERAGTRLEGADVPSLIRRPDVRTTRSDFIEYLTLSLAACGNFYLRRDRQAGEVINLTPLNPWECWPTIDQATGIETIHYRGKAYSTDDIHHGAVMRLPGHALGLGPIQAAQTELAGVRDIRDYASGYFGDTGQPAGIISTDQDASADVLKTMRNAWNYLDADGQPLDMAQNPSRIRALGKGMKYEPILISPKDAQWIEAQQFNTTQIARLFGIPAALMLAAVEGNAQTYSNVEQEWLAFTRFTLTGYLRKIEEALTDLTPRGQTVRFNLEALLRSDTTTRYQAHKTAIEIGLYDAAYARQIESIPDTAAPTATIEPAKDNAHA
jgi:HK97 family phage portal protein